MSRNRRRKMPIKRTRIKMKRPLLRSKLSLLLLPVLLFASTLTKGSSDLLPQSPNIANINNNNNNNNVTSPEDADYMAALSSMELDEESEQQQQFGQANEKFSNEKSLERRQVIASSEGDQQLFGDYSESSGFNNNYQQQASPANFPFFASNTRPSLHRALRAGDQTTAMPASSSDQASGQQQFEQPQQQQQQQKFGPQFIKEPPSFIHYLNSSDLVIPCQASGNPAPTITWWHKSRPLEMGSLLDKSYVRYDNSLVISSFKAHEFEPEIHSTSYKCQASSALGIVSSREVVISAVIDQEYEISVADQFVSVDNDALFKCQLNSPQVRDLFQVIGWLEDGQPMAGLQAPSPVSVLQAPSSPASQPAVPLRRPSPGSVPNSGSGSGANNGPPTRAFMLQDGQLYIQRAQLRDANKSYRCQMRNLLNGRLTSSSISGRLFVTDGSESGAAPRIIEMPPQTSVAKVNEPLMLVCLAQGSPRPAVRWFRQASDESWLDLGGLQAANESLAKYQLLNGGNLLQIRLVQLQDHGSKFKCLANNTFGAAQIEAELEVDAALAEQRPLELEPRLEYVHSNGMPASGQSTFDSHSAARPSHNQQQYLTLNCTIRRSFAQPLVGIEWLHNARPIFSVGLQSSSEPFSPAGGNSDLLLSQYYSTSGSFGSDLALNHSQALLSAASKRPAQMSLFDDQIELRVMEFPPASDDGGSLAPASERHTFLMSDLIPFHEDTDQSQPAAAAAVTRLATLKKLASEAGETASSLQFASSSATRRDHQHQSAKQGGLHRAFHTLRPVSAAANSLPNQQALLYQLHLPLPVLRQDRGSYQCRARTSKTSFQAASSLLLRDSAPQFVEIFSSQLLGGANSAYQPTKQQQHQQQQQQAGGQMSASLKCVASGAPLPEISWSLSGFQVPESARFRVGDYVTRDGLIVSFVNITNVQAEDGGLYECSAGNDVGRLRHSAWLNVTGPAVIRPMPNVSAVAGQSLALMCPVGGWPIEQISWFQNSTKLPSNHRQRVFPNGTLLVGDLNEISDSGQYSCQAKSNGSHEHIALEHVQITIKVPPLVEPFSFAKSLHRGQRYNIMCTVTRGDLPVSIRWFKDGHPLAASLSAAELQLQQQQQLPAQVSQTGDSNAGAPNQEAPTLAGIAVKQLDPYSSTLTFSSLQAAHRGQYSCEATNEAGRASQTSGLQIHVPPEWRIEPKDLSVTVGRTAVIDCQADGFPAARVEWRLSQDLFREPPTEFKPIISSLYMRVFENGSLIIYNTQRSDAGYYLCQASNGIGPAISRVIKLTVHVAAHFKTKIKSELIRRGQPARLRCEAIGDLPIEISWLKDKLPLFYGQPPGQNDEQPSGGSSSRYALMRTQLQDGLVSELSISETERSDSALFTCITQNSYGNDDTNIQLIVQSPPDAPQEIRIQEYEARSVKLSWIPGHSGNAPILRYVLMYAPVQSAINSGNTNNNNNNYINNNPSEQQQSYQAAAAAAAASPAERPMFANISVPGNESSCLIQGLSPLTEYQFHLLALNSLGSSKLPSEPIKFRTDDEAPNAPPLYVKAQALSSHSIRVKWRAPERRQHFGSIAGFYVGYKLQRAASPSDGEQVSASSNQNSNVNSKADSFIYKTVEFQNNNNNNKAAATTTANQSRLHPLGLLEQECQLNSLRRGQKYLIIVQPFNSRGAGPASEATLAETWRIDVPEPPILRMVARTSRSIHLAWRPALAPTYLVSSKRQAAAASSSESSKTPTTRPSDLSADELAAEEAQANEPILGFILTRRQVNPYLASSSSGDAFLLDDSAAGGQLGAPIELRLPSEHLSQIVDNLSCGTKYSFTISALNSVGQSAPSDPLQVKTEGSVPVAPDKGSLLTLNSSQSVAINLGAWHNGACAMRSFDVSFKPTRANKWTQLTSYKIQVPAASGPHPSANKSHNTNRDLSTVESRSMLSAPASAPAQTNESTTSSHEAASAANGTILLENLSQSLQYDLKIQATNEAGSVEEIYTFSTNPNSFAQHQRQSQEQLDSTAWGSQTGGEFQFQNDQTSLSELLFAQNATPGALLPFLLLLVLLAALVLSIGCLLVSRRRDQQQEQRDSSTCSLSTRSNQSANGAAATTTTLLSSTDTNAQLHGHHTTLAGQLQNGTNHHSQDTFHLSKDSPTLLLRNRAISPNGLNHRIRLSDCIYGPATTLAATASGSGSSSGIAMSSQASASVAYAPSGTRQHHHQLPTAASGGGGIYQYNNSSPGQHTAFDSPGASAQDQLRLERPDESNDNSNYAHLMQQSANRNSPHNAEITSLLNGSEAEMCLGAEALNLTGIAGPHNNDSQPNGDIGNSHTLGHPHPHHPHHPHPHPHHHHHQQQQQQQQQHSHQQRRSNETTYGRNPAAGLQQISLHQSSRLAGLSNTMPHQMKSSTLPSACHLAAQQQHLIDSLVAFSNNSNNADAAATYHSLQAALQQQQQQQSLADEQQLNDQITNFIDQQAQQQVYATVKRGCPRPPRLCDVYAASGPGAASIYQCAQQQPGECCANELCYAHTATPANVAQLGQQVVAAAAAAQFGHDQPQQQQQQIGGDYQQLRPQQAPLGTGHPHSHQ